MESKTLANVNSAFDLESLEIVDGIEVIEHFNDIGNENENRKNDKPIILGDLDSSLEIKYLTLLTLITIFTCYLIAVLKGHVPAWLPYISDCAVGYPEAYIFRSGMTLSSFFITLNYYEFYLFIRKYNKTIMPLIGFIVGALSNLGLSVVSVVNEKENRVLHFDGATLFFGLQIIFMWITNYNLNSAKSIYYNYKEDVDINLQIENNNYNNNNKKNKLYYLNNPSYEKNNKSIALKLFVSSLYTADIIIYLNYEIPIYEWIGVTLIILYNLTFISDFKNKLYIGIFS